MTNKAVREAYEEARQEQLRSDPERPLPPWEILPLAMREAMIHIFYAGGKAALREGENKGGKP